MRKRAAVIAAPIAAVTLAACGTKTADAPPAPPDPPVVEDPTVEQLRGELARERRAGRELANRLRHMLRQERRLAPGVRFARIAASQTGTPYVWGGSSPGGFDCSGLVNWSARKIGRVLPRTTYGLITAGRAISTASRRAWRPGDLVFAHTGHVEVYLGDGRSVEAPYSGEVVRIEAASSSPVAVRRVV